MQDLVLLQHLTRDVQRQIVRVHHAANEVQVVGHQILAVVHDEHTAHVQLDVVRLLLRLEHVERRALRHEQDRAELQLTLHREVLVRQRIVPVVRDVLVEGVVLLLRHLVLRTHPNRLLLVQHVPFVRHLLHLLRLLLLGRFLFRHFLHLRGILLLFSFLALLLFSFLLLLLLLLVIRHFLLRRLLHPQTDRETDELRVLLHQIADRALFQHVLLVALDVQNDLRSTAQRLVRRGTNRERTTRRRLPHVLLVVVALGDHLHAVSHQVSGVETHTELTNHRNIARSRLKSLHERLRSRASNGTQVVDQVSLCHTNTGITNRQRFVCLISSNLDHQLGVRLEL